MRQFYRAYRSIDASAVSRFVIAGCLTIASVNATAFTVYVPPTDAPGTTPERHGETVANNIQAAIDKISDYRRRVGKTDEAMKISLSGGEYRVASAVKIGPDAAPGYSPLIISSTAPGQTWISGGVFLPSPGPVTSDDPNIGLFDASAVSHLQVFDMSKSGQQIFGISRHGSDDYQHVVAETEIFSDGKPLSSATWPSGDDAHVRTIGEDHMTITADRSLPPLLRQQGDIWGTGRWSIDWAMETLPLRISPGDPATLEITAKPRRSVRLGQRFRLVNVGVGLDGPGKWYIDAVRSRVYIWAEQNGHAPQRLEMSNSTSLLTLEDAQNVHISGVGFKYSRGPAIVGKDIRSINIQDCEIMDVGGAGIILAGQGSSIENCKIHDVGDGGISLLGGNRSTLLPANLSASNNEIYTYNRWNSTYRPGILISGVGNSATHNKIHDAPHFAIWVHGNDNIVDGNEIYRVVEDAEDAGAIYMGRDWSERGNKFNNNYFHDIGSLKTKKVYGLYFDDRASGSEIAGNIFYHVRQPVLIGGGRDNNVTDNIMAYSSSRPIEIQDRGGRLNQLSGLFDNLRRVPYQSMAYAKYVHLSNILNDHPEMPKYNSVTGNIFVISSCADISVAPPSRDIQYTVLSNNICRASSGVRKGENALEYLFSFSDIMYPKSVEETRRIFH